MRKLRQVLLFLAMFIALALVLSGYASGSPTDGTDRSCADVEASCENAAAMLSFPEQTEEAAKEFARIFATCPESECAQTGLIRSLVALETSDQEAGCADAKKLADNGALKGALEKYAELLKETERFPPCALQGIVDVSKELGDPKTTETKPEACPKPPKEAWADWDPAGTEIKKALKDYADAIPVTPLSDCARNRYVELLDVYNQACNTAKDLYDNRVYQAAALKYAELYGADTIPVCAQTGLSDALKKWRGNDEKFDGVRALLALGRYSDAEEQLKAVLIAEDNAGIEIPADIQGQWRGDDARFDGVRALLALGRYSDAEEQLKAVLIAEGNAGIETPADIQGPRPAELLQAVWTWLLPILRFVLAFAALVFILWLAYRALVSRIFPWYERGRTPQLDIGTFDAAASGITSAVGIESMVEAALKQLKAGPSHPSLRVVDAPPAGLGIPEAVSAKSEYFKIISALVDWVFPPRVIELTARLQASKTLGAGLTAKLVNKRTGDMIAEQTLWQKDYGPTPKENGPTIDDFYALAEPVAAWTLFHWPEDKPFNVLGIQKWDSYALLRAGAWCHAYGDFRQARRLWLDALASDSRNVTALFNLGSLDNHEGEYKHALERLGWVINSMQKAGFHGPDTDKLEQLHWDKTEGWDFRNTELQESWLSYRKLKWDESEGWDFGEIELDKSWEDSAPEAENDGPQFSRADMKRKLLSHNSMYQLAATYFHLHSDSEHLEAKARKIRQDAQQQAHRLLYLGKHQAALTALRTAEDQASKLELKALRQRDLRAPKDLPSKTSLQLAEVWARELVECLRVYYEKDLPALEKKLEKEAKKAKGSNLQRIRAQTKAVRRMKDFVAHTLKMARIMYAGIKPDPTMAQKFQESPQILDHSERYNLACTWSLIGDFYQKRMQSDKGQEAYDQAIENLGYALQRGGLFAVWAPHDPTLRGVRESPGHKAAFDAIISKYGTPKTDERYLDFDLPGKIIQSDLKAFAPGDELVAIAVAETRADDGNLVVRTAHRYDDIVLTGMLDEDQEPVGWPYDDAAAVRLRLSLGTDEGPAVKFAAHHSEEAEVYLVPAAPAPPLAVTDTLLSEIEDIQPYDDLLRDRLDIASVEALLKAGAPPQGREKIARKLIVGPKWVYRWVKMADLMRLSGVGGKYAFLLLETGVDTLKELRRRNADNLHPQLEAKAKQLPQVQDPPDIAKVTTWIAQAERMTIVLVPGLDRGTELKAIDGITPHVSKLEDKLGIDTVEDLLTLGATPAARAHIAAKIGADVDDVYRWVKLADLLRLDGVGAKYALLLLETGMDTVKELRNLNATTLHPKLEAKAKQLPQIKHPPELDKVVSWIEQAKDLPILLVTATGPQTRLADIMGQDG